MSGHGLAFGRGLRSTFAGLAAIAVALGGVVGGSDVAIAANRAHSSQSRPTTIPASQAAWSTTASIIVRVGQVATQPLVPVQSAVIAAPDAANPTESADFLSAAYIRLTERPRAAAKLLAEQRAAAVAQAAAAARVAEQAAADASARAQAQAAARAAAGYVTRVWTSGFQDQINQCRGAVDVTAVYKVHVIAEHSNCGGSSFPTTPGAIVTVTGLDAGRYRVIGIVAHLNGLVNHAEDIPRGYELLFQTCAAGFTDMRFIALARIS